MPGLESLMGGMGGSSYQSSAKAESTTTQSFGGDMVVGGAASMTQPTMNWTSIAAVIALLILSFVLYKQL